MKRTFKGTLLTLGAIFLGAAMMFGVLVVTPEDTTIFNWALGLLVAGLCSSPLVMLVAIISGVATLIDTVQNRKKRKREYNGVAIMESDDQMADIMQRLTPEQREYLEQKLHAKRLGVGNDGELVSMNELLSDFDKNENEM